MLNEGWDIVQTAVQKYFSGGYLWIWFLCATACMVMNHKKKNACFLGWYIVICALVILNPVAALILSKLGMDGVYWRSLWLLPTGCAIAYVFTRIVSGINKKYMKIILVLVSVLFIIKSGSLIYTSANFKKADNPYKISDEVMEVCEYIEPGNTVLAPLDLLCWIRTYDADIYLPIGRQEIYFAEDSNRHQLVGLMANENILEVDYVAEYAIRIGYKYIVYRKGKQVEGNWEDYGYYFVGETSSHYIYAR